MSKTANCPATIRRSNARSRSRSSGCVMSNTAGRARGENSPGLLGKKAGRWVMNVLTIVSPGLKVLFERAGKPEVINRPEVLRLSGTAAVIACNHIGWVDSLWVAYAVYPRQLRYMSKQELFNSRVAKWILEQGGSFAVDREVPPWSRFTPAFHLFLPSIKVLMTCGSRTSCSVRGSG